MTLSTQAREYMAKQSELSREERTVIDKVFQELHSEADYYEVNVAKDDREAELEAALIKFIIDSRK